MGIRTVTIRTSGNRLGAGPVNKISMIGKRTRSRTRVNDRPRFGLLNWSLSVLLACAIGLGGWSAFQIAMVGRDLNALRVRGVTLRAQQQKLQEKLSSLESDAHLKIIGRRLGLQPPARDQKIHLTD